MIKGEKPSGYYVTYDGDGHKIEGESRQCIHCQYTWEYGPNRPKTTRGFCHKHKGFICCRSECIKLYGLAPTCDTFEEQQKRIQGALEKHTPLPELGLDSYELTQSGIIIRN